MRKNRGDKSSDIASEIASALGVKSKIILPTDDMIRTKLLTNKGWIKFQEYFVKERCKPEIRDLKFEGIKKAVPSDNALNSIKNADLVVLAPSNPLVSLNPIIQIPGIRKALIDSKAPKIGISPFIGNKTIKGPANKMMKELGKVPNALGFVEMYYDILDLFIIDKSDKNLQKPIYKLISNVFLSDILMKNQNDKLRLAKEILNVSEKLFCD